MQANQDPRSSLGQFTRGICEAAAELTRLQVAVIAALVCLMAAGAFFLYLGGRHREVEIVEGGKGSEGERQRLLSVHVAGAVASPGIYRVKEGSRVADALEAAGGAAPSAAVDELNLAEKIKDGSKVFVPDSSNAKISSSGQEIAGQPIRGGPCSVNINTADAAELDTLPGIGPSLAERIVEYRKSNGLFSSIEELDDVEGIGPKKMASLRDHIRI